MSTNRTERRRKEREKKKDGFQMHVEILQPWSTFVMKTQLPPEILQKMLRITDEIVANLETAVSWGDKLAGQIKDELYIKHEILEREDLMVFFLDVVRNFVIEQYCQTYPLKKKHIIENEWYTQMKSMWIISQKDNEYNPVHTHSECQMSTVMYLKIPEYLPSRKPDKNVDGAITFLNNAAKDQFWGNSQITIQPEVGDFFIFPASQMHLVYPFRTADGKGERRSVSFNATFSSKSMQEEERKRKEQYDGNLRRKAAKKKGRDHDQL